MDGDFVGRGVQDREYIGMRGIKTEERLISLPAGVFRVGFRMLPHVLPIRGSVL